MEKALNASPPTDGRIRVDICVCTFRRPALEETLRSLARLAVPAGVAVRVVVADNDEEASARKRVYAMADRFPFDLVYVHAPARNISIARNACLDATGGDYLAFIDDDETASTRWLAELLKAALREQADVVLGPVEAQYGRTAPRWMRHADLHSTMPVWVGGTIRTGYTCNVLVRRGFEQGVSQRFDLALGRSGGEDTDFFTRLHAAGARIAFAPDAVVFEPVPESRARFSWLASRRFRSGQTHGRLVAEGRGPAGRAAQAALAGAKAAWCFAVAAALTPFAVRRNRSALRGVLHIGAVTGLLGLREIEQYGESEPVEHGHAA